MPGVPTRVSICACVCASMCVCGLYVSEGVCLCDHVRFLAGGLGLGALWVQASVWVWGRGVCRSLGPCQLGGGVLSGPWGRRPCLPLPGGWVGGWAAGRWTDGGMRGRGMDRWARGEARRPGPSPPTQPQWPHWSDLGRWARVACLRWPGSGIFRPLVGGSPWMGALGQPPNPLRLDLLNSDLWPWLVLWCGEGV